VTDFVTDWVAHHARTTPDRIATIDLASGREHSYAQMHERVGRLELRAELPRNATGKVLKFVLRDELRQAGSA